MAYGITTETLLQAREEREKSKGSLSKDLLLAVPRGVEGTVQSVYQLSDWATGDRLPNYETKFLGTSSTAVGGLAEGVAQFAAGFIPIAGQVGKLAQGASWGSRLLKGGKAGKQVLNWKGLLAAEVTTDFVAFRSQEARLSNLVEMFPELQNPLTEWLAADEDDSELEGRFKNSLEGLGITGIVSPIFMGITKGMKKFKKGDVKGAKKEVANVSSLMRSVVDGNEKSYYGTQISDPYIKRATGITFFRDELTEEQVIKLEDIHSLRQLMGEGSDPIEAISPKATIGSILDRLETHGSDEQIRGFASALKKLTKDDSEFYQTTIQALASSEEAGGFRAFDAEGNWKPRIHLSTNRRAINEGLTTDYSTFQESTLLHEIVHAASAQKLPAELTSIGDLKVTGSDYWGEVKLWLATNDTSHPAYDLVEAYDEAVSRMPVEFQKAIEENFNDVDAVLTKYGSMRKSAKSWYGYINLDEFLSESLTNKRFQHLLKQMESKSTGGSIWDQVLSFFKNVFGKDVEGTLLEDVIGGFGKLVRGQKERWGSEELFDFGHVDSVAPQMVKSQRVMRSIHNATERAKAGINDLKIEFPEGRGGAIAVKGVGKTIKEANTSTDIDAIIDETTKFIESNADVTNKLTKEALSLGGVTQAVRRMAEAGGRHEDLLLSEVEAAAGDAKALRAIAARMYTVESMAVAQADAVYDAAKKISDLGTKVSDVEKAQFVGELKKLVEITNSGTQLRRGFGQGLRSTQLDRAKLSLTEAELREKDIVGEFMENNTGDKFTEIVNAILLEGNNPQDAINRMLGIAKTARSAEPKGVMEKTQNWFVNSLLSGPRTMMKNGIGNTVANVLLNLETAIGGAMVNPALTSAVLKDFFTLDSFRESMQYFLKTWQSKEQLLDIGRSPLENTKRTKIPLIYDNASPEDTFKHAINWIGQNIVNAPTRTLSSMDEVFKQAMFRQRAKLELTAKALELGLKDPTQVAEYVAKGLDALLINGERAWSKAGVIKHAHAQAKAADKALIEKGGKAMKPSERGAFIEQIIKEETQKRADMVKSWDEGGLGIKNLQELDTMSGNALERARYATFTNDAGKAAELMGGLTQTLPILKFVFPFIRTPINLIKFSLDRATFAAPEAFRHVSSALPDLPMLGQIQRKIRADLQSRDPLVKADAYGKLATSAMINGTLISLAMANRDRITGGGPKDLKQKKVLEQTGWQPYSFKVGDKYLSYNGLDPIGTHFGILVDIMDQMDEPDFANTGMIEKAMTAAGISLTRNVTEKSYLAGLKSLTDALSSPEDKFEKAVQNLAGGFVPNILYQGQSVVGDTSVREARSITDAILKKLPSGADRLDPKRNILGEAIIKEQVPFIGPFNPSAISTRDGDVVFEELAQLQHGFGNPTHMLQGQIDMTTFTNDKGQTAHDRRLELIGEVQIRGKTLRQALTSLVKSKKYQNLSKYSDGGFKSPRVDLINRVMSRYRTVALSKALTEFPELRRQHSALRKAEGLARRGASADTLETLLNFN